MDADPSERRDVTRSRALLGVAPGSVVSGAETVLLRDLQAARGAGWRVRLACTDGALTTHARDAGIERVRIPDLRLPEGRREIASMRAFGRAMRATAIIGRATSPGEVIVANGLNTLPALVPLARRNPVVYFAHDVLVRPDRVALLRLCSRWISAIAVSEAVATPLRSLGVDTTVVLNGTPWPMERAPTHPRDAAPIVGISALLTPWKGHAVLLEALALMQRRDAVLEVMGGTLPKDAAYVTELRARAARPDLAGRVRFLGHVADPLARMRSWDVAVSASVDPEAGPLTTLEAMSIGIPLVATDHGGVIEVLGDAGLLVPPRDARALAGAIDRLLDDDELWERCRAAGPKIVVERGLTLADHEARWLAALDAISDPDRHRRRA